MIKLWRGRIRVFQIELEYWTLADSCRTNSRAVWQLLINSWYLPDSDDVDVINASSEFSLHLSIRSWRNTRRAQDQSLISRIIDPSIFCFSQKRNNCIFAIRLQVLRQYVATCCNFWPCLNYEMSPCWFQIGLATSGSGSRSFEKHDCRLLRISLRSSLKWAFKILVKTKMRQICLCKNMKNCVMRSNNLERMHLALDL